MEQYAIGSLESGGINKQRANELIDAADAATRPACEKCFARLVCGGLCFHSTADGAGGVLPPSEFRCESVRSQISRSIGFLFSLRDDPVRAAHYIKATSV